MYGKGFIKAASVTPVLKVGNPIFNVKEMVRLLKDVRSSITVFPELGVTAYTCNDLFFQESLLNDTKEAIQYLLDHNQAKGIVVIGAPLEVDGVFDDCQEMVKTAFLDEEITKTLTSANSINVARWLPQMFYFFFAYKELHKKHKDLIFSVPSGNFGNICAGVMAQKLGLPIKHFVASTNINDTVPNYLMSGIYQSKPSKATISNAMDVGNPSNFIRIQELFSNDIDTLKSAFSSYSFTDDETRATMTKIYNNSRYVADPHGAIGYLGPKKHGLKENEFGVFLETAHPVKFLDIVEATLPVKVEIPQQIQKIINNKKVSIKAASYQDLKDFLMN